MMARTLFQAGVGVLMAGLLAVTACDEDPVQPGIVVDGNVDVEVRDNVFVPDTARIPMGGSVIWRWAGSNPHNVVSVLSPQFAFSTDTMRTGTHGPVTFGVVGTYRYICSVHGGISADSSGTTGMSGVVVVTQEQ